MTRRLQRRPDDPVADAERERTPAPPAPLALLELQRSAGNAAVARVLAREQAADAPVQLVRPQPLALGAPNPLTYAPQLSAEVEQAVDAWLTQHAAGFKADMLDGTISMPEIVDQVRRRVPIAADASPFAIQGRVYQLVGNVPGTRGKRDLGGRQAQQKASIANGLPSPPTSVTIGASKTSLTVGIQGAELKTADDGAHVTAKADQDGAEAEVKKGSVKVGASGKWDGSSFGLKTEVSGVKFGGKVERKGESWKWSGGLVFQLAGDEVDELPDVGAVVADAHSAISDSLGHLRGGGSPTDDYITGRMGKIKPAIDAAGKIAGRSGKSGATLRVTASGEDGGFTAGVSLVIVF